MRSLKAHKLLFSPKIIYGLNALEKFRSELKNLGNKALLVSDEVMENLGYVKKLRDMLENKGVKCILFNKVNSEPEDNHVLKGLKIYQKERCDFLIALGGGSPIDATKAIAAMVTNSGHINDYQGLGNIAKAPPPMVAIPTTAGTGSEVTQFTIITDTENGIKMLIGSEYLIPKIAVVDPSLTITMPAETTAATGIDALTHAIEAYTSTKHQPISDMFALSAISRIAEYLRIAWANNEDLKARSEMMIASMEAGIAFNNSSVTIVHGMSRPIGALFHVPHGVSNAVLLPACMEFAVMGNPKRFAEVAKALGIEDDTMSVLNTARGGVNLVKELCEDVEIPSISGLGIDSQEFISKTNKMARNALESGSPDNTARTPTKEQIIDIYKKVL